MNELKLHEAEALFLQLYPAGFADPAIAPIRRKHNVDQLVRFTQAALTRASCQQPHHVVQSVFKIISRSSMVSRFEKPNFRAFIKTLSSDGEKEFAYAIEQRLFGRKQLGFERLVALLAPHQVARWALVSAIPFYHAPRREAFVKPSTAKAILAFLEVHDLHYHSTPTWAFYKGYQRLLLDIRRRVHPSLSPSNAALSGFLMMSM